MECSELLLRGGRESSASVPLDELVDATSGIDEALLASVERVTNVADLDAELFDRSAGLEGTSATASDLAIVVVRVNLGFHSIALKVASRRRGKDGGRGLPRVEGGQD